MDNTGSFGSAIGGMSPELQAALQRRQGGSAVPPTAQVSNSAPTANPAIQAPQPPMGQSPQPSQTPVSSPSGSSTATEPAGPPFGSAEAKMILGSMSSYLKNIGKFHGV